MMKEEWEEQPRERQNFPALFRLLILAHVDGRIVMDG